MAKNILFLIFIGSFFAVSDTTAMFRALQSLKVNNRTSVVGKRFLSVHPNDPIKTYSVSRMCDAQTNEGDTSLHYVVRFCPDNEKVLVATLKGFPNPFIENNQGRTPRQEAEIRNNKGQYDSLIESLKQWEEAYYADFSEVANKSRVE